MNLARVFTSVLPAIAASLVLAACVDLTQPRARPGGQVSVDAGSGGSGGSVIAGPDASNGGSGASAPVGGVATGGTATGAAGGVTTEVGTSGIAAGGAGNMAMDAAAGATSTGSAGFDAAQPSDFGGSGSAGTGGRGTTGGASASGGKSATGGASGSGGKSATGGASASGGVSTVGRTSAVGGTGAAGGTSATGGAGGGASATGGTSVAGGTGGTTSTGGTVADAGVAPMIISIDFVGGMPPGHSGVTGTVAMAASESAGVKPATNWNSAANNTGTRSSLVLADGTATSASVAWNSPVTGTETSATWTLSWTDAPGDVRMMNGYLDPRATSPPATVTVSGLASPMSSRYDVYVYCFEEMTWGDTRTSKYTIGSTTQTVKQAEPPLVTSFAGFTLAPEAGAGNYVVFRNVTGTSFTLTATPGTSLHSTVRAPVNGIQIVYPSGF